MIKLYCEDIVHLDIKPHNILVFKDKITLCDFGLSHDFSKKKPVKWGCGTPFFMSPESKDESREAHKL